MEGRKIDLNEMPVPSPPRETDVDDVADTDGNSGGEKIEASPDFSFTTRQLYPMLEHNFGTVAKGSTFGGVLQPSHSTASEYSPESPNRVYLQTLREYIAERKGVLGEGWHVEFNFCETRYKTQAVYVAPDGSRLRSMEDVARHLGLPISYHSEPCIHDCLPVQFQHNAGLQTVGSGFFQDEQKRSRAFGTTKKSQFQLGDTEDILNRYSCPPGKPLSSRLPSYLLGDVLQVWELIWRFHEVLGLGQPFSLYELESELISPWLGSYPLDCGHEITVDIGGASSSKVEKFSQARASCLCKCTGLILTKTLGSLLKLLVSELLSKVAAYTAELNSRRGRRKDLDCLVSIKKLELDMLLPINELTWNEIARRYLLALLSFEGNLDSPDITNRESEKVFHCLLKGDGSLTSVAALERDALVLADAIKDIFGSLMRNNEIITICGRESNVEEAQKSNDVIIPEWALVLEPVKKQRTNVGSRIRKCIYEALEKNPPDWAKERLLHSISKEVYKSNASGPTKRAVISVLEEVSCRENLQQKAEKKEVRTTLHGLISKKCRVVLRRTAAAADNPGMLLSRPLNFRTIDLRLAAGVYNGSHEAFLEDVREVWHNIRTAYVDRSDLIDLANNLSQNFDDMYAKEVLTFVRKIAEFSDDNGSNGDAIREREDLLAHVSNSSIPRAPWEEGLCKVCGVDKDDKNVLLCDKCNSEYHTYCLSPPLLRIPQGNWYCPSCVAGQSCSTAAYGSATNPSKEKRCQGEFTRKYLESLAHFANLIDIKDYSEFSVEERVFFMKFLFDEALNSAAIRDHLEKSASRAADLQQKLGSLTSELKVLKFKEEMLALSAENANSSACNRHGDLKSDASSSLLTFVDSYRGKPSEKSNHLSSLSSCSTQLDGGSCSNERSDIIKNEISSLQASIASTESELSKVSLRKDLLGRDSNGTVYWAFCWPGARPCVLANGSLTCIDRAPKEFITSPDSDIWMVYESDAEIYKLVRWLRDDNISEKELKESILQLQGNKSNDSDYTENHVLSIRLSNRSAFLSCDFLATKALTELEKKFGSCLVAEPVDVSRNGRMYRCECLELVWPSKEHCFSCHQSFSNSENLRKHSVDCNVSALINEKSLVLQLSKSRLIAESSSRALVSKGTEILNFLKMNLLDMDAALPNDALRQSRSSQDRRCAWRAFVKSAKSIYEMVQATIVLEDTIKSEYLQSNWRYWSSPSTAAKISSLSALALRIYSLDSAISYKNLFSMVQRKFPSQILQ